MSRQYATLPYEDSPFVEPTACGEARYETRAMRMQFSNHRLNKSRGSEVERLITFLTIMKKLLFALSMLAFVVSALPQTRGADVTVDFIYDNLSGGNWIDVEGYGYGWQPDVGVSDPNWRPYSDGYWAYTDYGWTWISYEDFGWATYHYGRWANLGDYGWVWFPGTDLDWGPAWVSWRTGGDYIGWAPLPPRGPGIVYEGRPIGARVDIEYDIGPQYYNFCDIRFIGEPVLRDRIFPPTQNITYITNTVNVTNIYVQNNVVYNYGPDYNVVSSYSSRPIQRLTIERGAATDLSAAARSGGLTKVQGNKLLVAAPPKFAAAPPTVKPQAVKAKVAQPKFERGWQGVQNKTELEQKIKTENPKNVPPPSHGPERPTVGGGPAPGGPPTGLSPSERGKPGRAVGRMPPGMTPAGPPEGTSPAPPFERGKGKGRAGQQPGFTPGAPPTGGSPAPFERGKPGRAGARGQPGLTPGGGPEGISPAPFEGRERQGKPGAGAPPNFQPSPPAPEHGRPPMRKLGESPIPGSAGGQENVPRQGRGRGPASERFGTPPPTGAGGYEQRAPEHRPPPPALNQPGGAPPKGGAPGEARDARGTGQGAYTQPGGPPPRGGGQPPAGERAPKQPERGQKKPEKGTPPPGPQ